MAVTPLIEQEAILTYDKQENEWHFYSDVPVLNRKWQHLVEADGITVEPNGTISYLEGTVVGNVTIAKKRSLTEVQRKELAERLSASRK